MVRRKKVLLVLTALFILSVVPIVINNIRYVEVCDGDLIYHPKKIEDGKNAFIALLPILEQIKEENPDGRIIVMMENEATIDYAELDKLVKQYSHFLEGLSESLSLNSFQVPLESYLITTKTERYTLQLSFLSKLQFLYIKKLLHEGNNDAAFQEMLKLFKYGYLLQNSNIGLIHFMLGAITKSRALDLMIECLPKSKFNSNYYKELLKGIEKYADNNAMKDSFKIEYMLIANTLNKMFENGLKEAMKKDALLEIKYKQQPWKLHYLYNHNATIDALGKYFRQEIKNLERPYVEIKHINIFRSSNQFVDYLYLLAGNSIGKIFLQMLMPRFDGRVEQKVALDASSSLTKLLLAFKGYYADTNDLPDSLSELVPNYIGNIPEDPFDNRELRYSKAEGIIYSVGGDVKDDKGDEQKDICMKLNFK